MFELIGSKAVGSKAVDSMALGSMLVEDSILVRSKDRDPSSSSLLKRKLWQQVQPSSSVTRFSFS
ncbi:MAG: hypothetical protein LLG04_06285 [Parachlamydia sp.]|nr:hypothetical protein [Parachlamydia sp.]